MSPYETYTDGPLGEPHPPFPINTNAEVEADEDRAAARRATQDELRDCLEVYITTPDDQEEMANFSSEMNAVAILLLPLVKRVTTLRLAADAELEDLTHITQMAIDYLDTLAALAYQGSHAE